MGSPSFGLPGTSNNAPPPIPGNTNPTGTNNGVGFGGNFPSYPMFGAPSTSPTTPSANAGVFNSGDFSSLYNNLSMPYNSTFAPFYNEIGKAYGEGTSQAIFQEMNNMFSPQVAAAFLNAMQPGINQGAASVENSFGAEGSRFGSAAALGLGNYESQANLNEQQTLASMYENAQAQQLQLTEAMLPTLHQ